MCSLIINGGISTFLIVVAAPVYSSSSSLSNILVSPPAVFINGCGGGFTMDIANGDSYLSISSSSFESLGIGENSASAGFSMFVTDGGILCISN